MMTGASGQNKAAIAVIGAIKPRGMRLFGAGLQTPPSGSPVLHLPPIRSHNRPCFATCSLAAAVALRFVGRTETVSERRNRINAL